MPDEVVWVDVWFIIEDSSEWKQFQCLLERVCNFIQPIPDKDGVITNNTLRAKKIADSKLLTALKLQIYVETRHMYEYITLKKCETVICNYFSEMGRSAV